MPQTSAVSLPSEKRQRLIYHIALSCGVRQQVKTFAQLAIGFPGSISENQGTREEIM